MQRYHAPMGAHCGFPEVWKQHATVAHSRFDLPHQQVLLGMRRCELVRMRSSSCSSFVVGLTLIACLACSDSTSAEDELTAARTRWAQEGPRTYVMVLFRSCECTPEMTGPVRVTVANGNILSRRYTENGTIVSASMSTAFPDVEGLFDFIEDAQRQNAFRLDVRYDPLLGYPTLISVDYDRMIADDEFVYTTLDFHAAGGIGG